MRLTLNLAPQWVTPFPDDAAKFRLRPLTGAQRMELSAAIVRNKSSLDVPAADQLAAIRASLIGWDGITNEDTGDPVEFDLDYLDAFPDEWLWVLFGKVYEVSTLQRSEKPEDDEAGN